MSPRVSVVVPAYNNGHFIAETVQSILDQSYRDFELIIADHSSTDHTLAAIEPFQHDGRLRLLHTEAGGGAKRNWDRVSQSASGELLKLVCGDDLIHPDALAEQVEAFDAHPSAVLVATQRRLADARGGTVISARGLGGLSGLVPGDLAARRAVTAGANIFGEPACVMLKRKELEAVGWWQDTHPYLIDQATFIAVALRGDFVAIPKPLATFRISSNQWSVRLATEQAKQAAGFHAKLRATHPDLLSRRDVWVGDAKALATSFMRRAVYVLLNHRMKHPRQD
ncbi:glycosyltransferase family 2 protein [Skermania sp. ID1734]|uniref:glycosyltransferase family 2 protein n=1 Tax=Skermania sp. ID1734 TaxID=2597516 RepID=UPI00117FF511|nr:glycosyltransferase family 2 protein [Skermania sp. ID1734]TSE00715.1 glycosyltransferase family 2 protein [Skermania sp. ID1734]